jgi:dipeptidase E
MTPGTVAADLLLLGAGHGAVRAFVAAGCTVLAITTAANPARIDGDPPQWLRDSLRLLGDLGCAVVLCDVAGKEHHEIRAELGRVDAVYVSGGNTFYLLQELRRSGGDDVLREYLEVPGHRYIGASAGAVVLARDIRYAAPVDDPDAGPALRSTRGLGVLVFAPVPHANRDSQGRLLDGTIASCAELARRSGQAVETFGDDEALVVRGSRIRRVASPLV